MSNNAIKMNGNGVMNQYAHFYDAFAGTMPTTDGKQYVEKIGNSNEVAAANVEQNYVDLMRSGGATQ